MQTDLAKKDLKSSVMFCRGEINLLGVVSRVKKFIMVRGECIVVNFT